jgi:hypothetical protein
MAPPRPLLVLAAAATAAAGVGFALSRLRRPDTAPADRPREAVEEVRCDCGQAFRVTGMGRHRVFWLADAAHDDPILSRRCPSCDRPLPGEKDAAQPETATSGAAQDGGRDA